MWGQDVAKLGGVMQASAGLLGAHPGKRLESERGNRPAGPFSPPHQGGKWEGPSPADAGEEGRRTRSSPRSGKPATWRRGPACSQH